MAVVSNIAAVSAQTCLVEITGQKAETPIQPCQGKHKGGKKKGCQQQVFWQVFLLILSIDLYTVELKAFLAFCDPDA